MECVHLPGGSRSSRLERQDRVWPSSGQARHQPCIPICRQLPFPVTSTRQFPARLTVHARKALVASCYFDIPRPHLEISTDAATWRTIESGIGARLRWAVRVGDEPTATEGGDPSGTFKRWFGRNSGCTGWRGSSLVDDSRRLESLRRCAQAFVTRATEVPNGRTLRCSCRAATFRTDHARAGNGGASGSAVFFLRAHLDTELTSQTPADRPCVSAAASGTCHELAFVYRSLSTEPCKLVRTSAQPSPVPAMTGTA
jgi:hypothetical protein